MTWPWMLDEPAHAGAEHLDPASPQDTTASRDIRTRARIWPFCAAARALLTAAGFTIVTADFTASTRGAYTCVRAE